MEKRAVVTNHNTPDLKKGVDILQKNAAAFNAYMDKVMGEMSESAKQASAEDAKTFEEENK